MFLVVFMFLALIVFGLYLALGAISKQNEEYKQAYTKLIQGKGKCPPEPGAHHKWSYHPITNKLTCTKCNFEAGSQNEQIE